MKPAPPVTRTVLLASPVVLSLDCSSLLSDIRIQGQSSHYSSTKSCFLFHLAEFRSDLGITANFNNQVHVQLQQKQTKLN